MAATAVAANTDRALVATGGGWELDALVTLSGSYSTGGDALDFGPFFSQQGQGIVDKVVFANAAGYMLTYDYTNKKVIVRQGDNTNVASAPGVELAAAAYPAALTAAALHVYVRGR